MTLIAQILNTLPSFIVMAILDIILLLIMYGIFHALHLKADWAIWGIGALFLSGCVAYVSLSSPSTLSDVSSLGGGALGLVAVFAAIYSIGQWSTRGWYVTTKSWIGTPISGLSRNLLILLRKYHVAFGWAVLILATAHALLLIPGLGIGAWFARQPVWTGIIDWGVLIILVVFGWWLDRRTKSRTIVANLRWWHVALAIAFWIALIVHIAVK